MAKKESAFFREVVAEYRKQGSIRATAAALNISESKARKILIKEREVEYDRTHQAMVLLKYGRTLEETADSLGVSMKVLNSYLPYSKGDYGGENPSENALRIREFRNKKSVEK